jgi:putative DNA primase/helicase
MPDDHTPDDPIVQLDRVRRQKRECPAPSAKPIVQITGGALPESIDAAERHLLAADRDIYQRGDFVVRPAPAIIQIADNKKVVGLRLVPIKPNHMAERFTAAVDFQRFDKRCNEWVRIDCPPKIAATYLERVGLWRLPVLTGIVNCPTLRPDGSILDQPGYDRATGLLYDPRGVIFPPISSEPAIGAALAALAKLKLLICEFPFVGEASLSVALSGILTTLIRRSIPTAPLHGFTAPVAGSGKSKLVDVASMFGVGHEAPVIAPGKTEEEMEKRLGAMLLSGDAIMSFDNCDNGLGGAFLCQCLTQTIVKPRILGKSETPNIPSNASMFATANNLTLLGDMIRRSLMSTLDPQCEQPELRRFKTEDPVLTLRRERPALVVAALTMLRAFVVAGSPPPADIVPLGSFEDWSKLVRACLIWLGEADPCTTMGKIRAGDPRLATLTAVIEQWDQTVGTSRTTVSDVIEKACLREDAYSGGGRFLNPSLRDALLIVAGQGGMIDGRRLGNWLSANKERVVNYKRFIQDGTRQGTACWRIERIDGEHG